MLLNKVEFTNFRNFKNLEIELHKRYTIIVGANGAGKTNILDGISIAAGTFLYGIDGVKRAGINKSDARKESFSVGSVIDLQPQFPVIIKAKGVFDNKECQWSCSLNSLNGKTHISEAREITNLARDLQKEIRSGNQDSILPIVSYYGTGRLWAKKRAKTSSQFKAFNRFTGYVDCIDIETNEKLMLKWFQKMTLQEAQNGELSPELSAVKSAITSCFKSITNYDYVKPLYNLDTNEIDIVYSNAYGEKKRMPMSSLSDGYKNTISMISDIAYRMAVLNPQLLDHVLDTPGVVIIDEIDLHLHPSWQQIIIGNLLDIFPNVQFIFSTHAASVINSALKENLVIVKDETTYIPNNETYGKDVNSIIKEIMHSDERPRKIIELFSKFYSEMDSENYTLAKEILSKLDDELGGDDPELNSCHIKYSLETL